MRSKAWLAARVSLRLARLPRTASSAQHSRRLRSTRAAAPVLLAHADVTNIIIFFFNGPNTKAPHGTCSSTPSTTTPRGLHVHLPTTRPHSGTRSWRLISGALRSTGSFNAGNRVSARQYRQLFKNTTQSFTVAATVSRVCAITTVKQRQRQLTS